jgi:hypothetical protein
MPKLALIGLFALATAGASPHVIARIETGSSPGGAVSAFGAVRVAKRSLWHARIDPATNRVTRPLRLRPGLFSVTRGFGALWAVNYERGSLARVNPRLGRVRTLRVGLVPFDVVAAFGRVWVTAWQAGRLIEVDPRSLRVVRRIPVGPRPTGLHASARALWIGFGRAATSVARVDPRTRAIERVPVGVRAPSWSSRARVTCGSRRPTTCSSASILPRAASTLGFRSGARLRRAPGCVTASTSARATSFGCSPT